MRLLNAFLWLLAGAALSAAQSNDPAGSGRAGARPGNDKTGAAISFAMTEKEYLLLMKRLSGRGDYVELTGKPAALSPAARFGTNLVVNGKNIGWALDGDAARGYLFYADWNADGDLRNDPPVRLKKNGGKYSHRFTEPVTKKLADGPRPDRFDLTIEVAMVAPPGETAARLAIKIYDSAGPRAARRAISLNERDLSELRLSARQKRSSVFGFRSWL